MMLNINMVLHHHQEHLPIEEITSPFGGQMFEYYESELFPETLQNNISEVASSSNCCYEEHSSYQTPLSTTVDISNYTLDNNDINSAAIVADGGDASNLSVFLEEYQIDNNDISASIDFTLSPSSFNPIIPQYNNNSNSDDGNNQDPFSVNNQISYGGDGQQLYAAAHQYTPEQRQAAAAVGQVLGPPPMTTGGFREELMRCVPSFIHLRSASSPGGGSGIMSPFDHMMGPYLPPQPPSAAAFPFDSSLFLGSDHISGQELDCQGDNIGGLFLQDSMARVFNFSSGDLQGLSGADQRQHQQLVQGSPTSTNLASGISSLEDPSFKVGKLSPEEKKRKIHKYLKKRNERNFSKKIKYACRKTLADSRPRVRGRFAKNDELAEIARTACTNNGDDTDEDVTLFSNLIPDHHNHKVGKEGDVMESSDIFAQINGVNGSFKSNYPIQSWI